MEKTKERIDDLEETPHSRLPYSDFGDSIISDKQQMKKKVFVSGCYDLLHSGHVEFFQQASRYGDLYVGIGSDATYLEYKHRKPMFPQEEKLFMVKNIKAVKDAYINEGSGVIDFLPTLDKVKPDVFVVNAEGGSDEKRRICKERGIEYVELQRTPHAGLKARSSSDLKKALSNVSDNSAQEAGIPTRLDLAGTWIDQPYVSMYHPGWAITISLEPTFEVRDRCGLSTSTRKMIQKIWPVKLPKMDPEMLARLVFCFENNPERHDGIISGAQDSIGICVPGLVPFLIISSLFFMWGFAHGILEVLNPHFQESFHISKAMSALTQAAVYGAYFLMALPAGWIIRKWGYRRGVITGLVLFGIGALMFIPGSRINSFYFFVLSLFVIGCGLTCLETSANPYTTVLGHPDKAESRINLSQSLNGIGWIVGPLVGGQLLFSGINIAIPYALVGIFVLSVALVLSRIKLPDPRRAHEADTNEMVEEKPMRVMAFVFGMLTLFLYVAAQTGVNSFFINYAEESIHIEKQTASLYLAFGGMGLFFIGRLAGGVIMNYIQPRLVLLVCAILTFVATLIVVVCSGTLSLIAFFALYLGESIMFPTIFSLALRDAGTKTKLASSLLIMTIVGGAVAPVIMGYIADTTGSMAIAFLIPLVCYGVIGGYALSNYSGSSLAKK